MTLDIIQKIKELTRKWKLTKEGIEEPTEEDHIDFEKAKQLLEERYNLTQEDVVKLFEKGKKYNIGLAEITQYLKRVKDEED